MRKPALAVLLLFSLYACQKDDGDANPDDLLDDQLTVSLLPYGGNQAFLLPGSSAFDQIPQDPLNPLTAEKVNLGKLLFHETGLGSVPKLLIGQGTYSCASCHHVAAGFQAGIPQGIGEGGVGFGQAGEGRINDPAWPLDSLDVQPIRSPTAMNIAYQELMLWNGQFGATGMNTGTESRWTDGTPIATNFMGYQGPETQAIAGMKVHRMDVDETLLETLGYKAAFDEVFASFPAEDRYSRETAGLAMAAYERAVLANQAPFQRWLAGDKSAMSAVQKEGAILFFGDAGCVSCHNGPALSSMAFYALGMNDLDGPGVYGTSGDAADVTNLGRGGFTGNPQDNYKFKVPQLYNLREAGFYGHGANFTSIREVIEYKNQAIAENTNVPAGQLADQFVRLQLSTDEMDALTEFIENGLQDPNLQRYVPSSLPSNNCFPNADEQSRIDLGCN